MTNRDRKALLRIVAMLLSLANLAEQASLRSHPILCLVLLILRPAEAFARNFAIGAAQDLGAYVDLSHSCFQAATWQGICAESSEEALRLAMSLRMLAGAVKALEDIAFWQCQAIEPTGLERFLNSFRAGLLPAIPLCLPVSPRAAYNDTS